MRRKEPIRIGEALDELFKSMPTIARKIAEAKIPDRWPLLVGSVIASYTTRMEVKNGRLFVYISSSVARNEVFMRRAVLKEEINRLSGLEVISTIIGK